MKTIIIPTSVTTINANAFTNSGLTSIEIPATVTKIEGYAFSSCKNLETVIYPYGGVETVANNIFSESKLTEIVIRGKGNMKNLTTKDQ